MVGGRAGGPLCYFVAKFVCVVSCVNTIVWYWFLFRFIVNIYIYVCVCVCLCVAVSLNNRFFFHLLVMFIIFILLSLFNLCLHHHHYHFFNYSLVLFFFIKYLSFRYVSVCSFLFIQLTPHSSKQLAYSYHFLFFLLLFFIEFFNLCYCSIFIFCRICCICGKEMFFTFVF